MTNVRIASISPLISLTETKPVIIDNSYGEVIRIENADEIRIKQIDFGGVERGNITEAIMIYVRNMTDSTLDNVKIKPIQSILQKGEITDTLGSTFISLDGYNYFNEIRSNIKTTEPLKVYLKWQPRWLALPIKHQWSLIIEYTLREEDSDCPPNIINITVLNGITLSAPTPVINPITEDVEVIYDAYDGDLDEFDDIYGSPMVVDRV